MYNKIDETGSVGILKNNLQQGLLGLKKGEISDSLLFRGYYNIGEESLIFDLNGKTGKDVNSINYQIKIANCHGILGNFNLTRDGSEFIVQGDTDKIADIPTQLLSEELKAWYS